MTSSERNIGRTLTLSEFSLLQRRENRHGLSRGDFWRLWERQGGLCGICREPLSDQLGKYVHVDHDWRCCPPEKRPYCGECVRGLLCHECNTGRFGPYPEVLRRAADWFEFGPVVVKAMRNQGSVFQLKNGRWALVFSVTSHGKRRQVRRTFSTEEEAIAARIAGGIPPKARAGRKPGGDNGHSFV